jgi:hypothetical protein
MGKTMKYVLEPDKFDGSVVTTMHDGIHNDYSSGETLEELRRRENNPNLQALSPEELTPVVERYEQSLCKPFEEITEEKYWDLLECLPPERYNGNSFFMSECYYGTLYRFCFRLNGKYYSALRSIFLTNEEISAQIKEFSNSLKK